MNDTFIDILPSIKKLAEKGDYVTAICVIVGKMITRTERNTFNWQLKSNDITQFVPLLLDYVSKAEALYPQMGYDKGIEQAQSDLKHLQDARASIHGIPEDRRRSGLSPYLLDTLTQALSRVVTNTKIYNTAQDHYARKELEHASTNLAQCQHPDASRLHEEIQKQIEQADQYHRDAEKLLWQRAFTNARQTFEQGHAIFPRDALVESFNNTLRLAEQADRSIQDAQHIVQKCNETGTDEGLHDTCRALDDALVILNGLGPEAREMQTEATELKAQALNLRAKRAYSRYEDARARRHLKDAIDALETVTALGIGYEDAAERLAEAKRSRDNLQNAAQKAHTLKSKKDLDAALKTVADALSSPYDTPELKDLQRDIQKSQQQTKDQYEVYEQAAKDGNLNNALDAIKKTCDIWPTYRDAQTVLAKLQKTQQNLAHAHTLAEQKHRDGDLDTAENIIIEALSGDYTTPDLKTLKTAIANRKKQAADAFNKGQSRNAQTPRPVEEVLAKYREAVDLFSHNTTYQTACDTLSEEVRLLAAQYQQAIQNETRGNLDAARSDFAQLEHVLFRDAAERHAALVDALDTQLPSIRRALDQQPPDFAAALKAIHPLKERYPAASDIDLLTEEATRLQNLHNALAEAHQLVDDVRDINPSALRNALSQVFDLEADNVQAHTLAEKAVAHWRDQATRVAGDFHPQKALQLLQNAHAIYQNLPALRALTDRLADDQPQYQRQIQEARQAFRHGQDLIERREFGQAKSALEKARRLDADLKGVHETLQNLPDQKRGWETYLEGQALEDSGDPSAAYDLYVKALKLLPEAAEIQTAHDRVIANLGLRESFRLIGDRTSITVLIGDHFDIGRNHPTGRTNDIAFRSDCISRTHGSVYRTDNGWVYEDTSRKVTDINGIPKDKHILTNGDKLTFWDPQRAVREIVEIDARISANSAALHCREQQTARVGNSIQFLDGPPRTSIYILAGTRMSLGASTALIPLKNGAADLLWDGACVKVWGKNVNLNGEPIDTARPLRNDDILEIGDTKFRVETLIG